MTDPTETPEQAAQPGHGQAPTKTYDRDELSVVWEAGRCIHTGKCIQALPQAFDPTARPWVRVDAADAEQVAAAVRTCPTGALRYDGHSIPAETADASTTVRVSPDGPLMVRGAITVVGPDGVEHQESRVALCRCGATGNAPYCDNSHQAVGFKGGPLTARDDQPEVGPGPCRVEYDETGPYGVKGPARVTSPAGAVLGAGDEVYLCRCGRSGSKPFCDGSHNRPTDG